MTDTFKPMLASPADLKALKFPRMVSPKLDGIRALARNGLYSRSLKSIPNCYIRDCLRGSDYEGMDGELTVGSVTAHDVYRQSVSAVMSIDGRPAFTYWVFDLHNRPDLGFHARHEMLRQRCDKLRASSPVSLLPHAFVKDLEELLGYEAKWIDQGFEGIMIRDPNGRYKYGRSSTREQILLKLKRFEDSEAEIIGVVEEMFNGNAAETNELGRTKRSTAKAGLIGKGTMGALTVRDLKHGWVFNIGTGFTAADRAALWKLGTLVKYKYFPVGMKDVPRHPVYLGLRDPRDL